VAAVATFNNFSNNNRLCNLQLATHRQQNGVSTAASPLRGRQCAPLDDHEAPAAAPATPPQPAAPDGRFSGWGRGQCHQQHQRQQQQHHHQQQQQQQRDG